MTYSLKRESDGAGDSGLVSDALWLKDDKLQVEHNARPRVGVAIQVGSPFARTMQYQDWWQTSLCTDILIDEENYVKFKTGNSTYEWRQF